MRAYIEKVVVEGFKSFGKERKEIPLGKGFISIVGPNGAGKSNIGDAISFALGIVTTKTLRAKNLSYLIFSKDGDKADYAYIEVHFKNEGLFPLEEEKVIVSRRVTQDGRSTFKVNGLTVRERDLRDFLSKAGIYENGYNVVLQGDIVKFLKMTPVERRKVIEDVAGISEYEEKKQRAINDLAEVDIKIRELKLLLEELTLQLERLKEEKERLERYRKLKAEKKETEALIISHEIRKHKIQEVKQSGELNSIREKLDKIKEILKEKEEILKLKEDELKKLTDQLLPFKEKLGKISSDLEHISREIELKRSRKNEILHEKEKELKTLSYLKKDMDTLIKEKEFLEKEIELREKELADIKLREEEVYSELKKLDEKLKVSIETAQRVEEKEKQLKDVIENKKEEENNLKLSLKELELKINQTFEEIEKLRQEKEEFVRKREISLSEAEKYRKMKSVEQDILKKEKEYMKKLEEELKEIRKKLEDLLKTKGYVESKLALSEDQRSVFANIEGVYGFVGDLITVKEPQFIKAVESAGGARLKYVVVENEDIAKICIEYLRKNNLGRMSFIPLNRIRTDFKLPPYPRIKGAVDFAINLVEYDKKFEKAVRFALGDTLIVESFDTAKKIGIGNYRMVTLEGDIFEKSGIISGGQTKESDLGRKFYEEEKRKLETEEEELREKEQDVLIKLRALRNEIAEKEGVLKVLNQKLEELEKISSEGASQLRAFDSKIKKAQEYVEILKSKKIELENKLKDTSEEIGYLQEKLRNLSLKKQDIVNYYRSSGIEGKRAEYERLKKKVEEKRAELEKYRLSLGEKESEIKSIREEIERRESGVEYLESEYNCIEEEVESLKKHRKDLEEKIKDMEANVYHLYRERDAVEEEVKRLQSEIGRLRIEEEDLHLKSSELSASLSRIRQKLTDLEQRLKEIGYENILPESSISVLKLKEKLFRLERELDHIGNVNMKADEDYNEELKRYKDYESKYRKLQEERKAIKEMIEEIETKKLNAFMEAFKHINRSLKKVFSFLSPGGKAQMIIENEIDPFSGGISLMVKPRGKDVQYLEAMSGGEKTLAALSLIFAIQEYKPSPFYYFDEVDAHLDEANAKKVGELIKEKSKYAQFIVVTLREVLASFADKLIGVSARGGVSRVFPVENLSAVLREREVS